MPYRGDGEWSQHLREQPNNAGLNALPHSRKLCVERDGEDGRDGVGRGLEPFGFPTAVVQHGGRERAPLDDRPIAESHGSERAQVNQKNVAE